MVCPSVPDGELNSLFSGINDDRHSFKVFPCLDTTKRLPTARVALCRDASSKWHHLPKNIDASAAPAHVWTHPSRNACAGSTTRELRSWAPRNEAITVRCTLMTRSSPLSRGWNGLGVCGRTPGVVGHGGGINGRGAYSSERRVLLLYNASYVQPTVIAIETSRLRFIRACHVLPTGSPGRS